ncbi:hypothetical protein BFJ63_vAg13556 [Fusarium oxysporum f. sp. narcissi]|jgi:hypothetical protein|uniref:PKD domain-containing protein n=3 Tax=cellular organisms TaxID=131567 RepID=A0A4Q2VEE3_FUSOX|nr:hypothetical protein BFJ72_g14304 [Fusarium proliferatum]RYC83609.1 hypothetical protein BFJ63_vAg13556 [Fusarium oxysporum f. sp. narcissi]
MIRKHQLSQIAVAISLVCGGVPAHAALVAGVCEVNGIAVCGGASAPAIPAAGVLTIRGYAFDMATNDRPNEPAGGFVIVRNEDTLVSYKLPVQRIEARPDLIVDKIDGEITPEQYALVNSGFIAQVFSASLPPGHYTIQDVRLSMRVAGMTVIPIADADQRGSFKLPDANSPFTLVKADGTNVPLKMTRTAPNTVNATGYPALRDDNFEIRASLPGVGGEVVKSVPFAYKRPILSVPVSLPIVEGFPGTTAKISPTNPLNNRSLDVAEIPVVIESATVESMEINGTKVEQGTAMKLPRQANLAGLYPTVVKDAGTVESMQPVKLWVDLPDGPNIIMATERWDPSSKIMVKSSKDSAAIKVEDIDISAKLEGGTKETCSTLSMVRTGYMLSQTAGVNCAIQFGDLPEGLKYNPYASNALRGSLPVVGANVIDYTPGVVYTDPSTRQTAFYPSRKGRSAVAVEGLVPAPIALAFKNDKLLDTFYAKNADQYPGKNFATVDRTQARALGVMNVKGGYREIMTRIVYPGDVVKEVFSSVAESNVALIMQATDPWESYPVKVESWYQRAPEFKTEQSLDFIGVPATPLVDLEKAFASHDQADTVIHGQVGIPKGTQIVFDPASMGKWQVVIREDKTNNQLSVPVSVGEDGTFTVNMGRLTAGTRYIVAEAKMISTDGLVTNSSVLSKSRALITAAGERIEASLSSRATSGKAPFVQTINANVKNSKMLANVKSVSWEFLQADGTWARVMRSETVEQTGINFTAQVAEAGSVTYRAVLTNKYSGAEFSTDPLTLTAFDVPSFRVTAPGVVQVGRPVTLEVQADDGFDAAYTWRIITTGGYEGVSGENSASFTFTPTEIKNYAIEVKGRSASAPDNPAADVTKTLGVKAVNPLAARASISGPTYLEAGKSYAFKAQINDVVPTTAQKAYKVLGYWSLPDGTRVDGTELQFVPRPEDKVLSYYTYVEGYPEETTVATLPFKTWAYNWPQDWKIRVSALQTDVPAVIKYQVETPGFDLKTLNGEPLTYTWSLPSGITRSSGNDVAGNFTVAAQGTYQLALQVSDTRGNVVNVYSDEFTILPPATVQTQASMVSKYGESYYAPGTYYISLKISQLPRGDSFLRNDVLINGAKVGEFTGSGNYVSFTDPGNYEVLLRTITKAGNYGEQALQVNVQEAPRPQCELKQTTSISGLLLTPVCTVSAGYIKSLTWTYDLDGVAQKATSKTFLVTKAWLAANRVSNLRLTIESDLGAKSEEPVLIQ